MKKSIYALMVMMVFNIGYVLANTPEVEVHEPKALKVLTSQIYEMLGTNVIPNDIRGSKAEVRVAVDEGNYLRILSIETENEALKDFLKSAIDFEKLSKGTFEKGIVYRIPIEVAKR
ncbi:MULTISPECIES: hypothetical protein [Zobellia]|uniref:hypothetical protein n=1 Tax=Zobellia TaxID=112040 RepID=UPI001BFFBE07|nr:MULTISPECIES: hypothetical protein [Zobellia]MBT9190040.1 hypothetical protein [Zobellia russellii]MBU2973879.1 hypothetical protein [Zobellia sp. B3R18]